MGGKLLPGCGEIKPAVLLCHLNRFTYHSFHLIIVPHLVERGKGRSTYSSHCIHTIVQSSLVNLPFENHLRLLTEYYDHCNMVASFPGSPRARMKMESWAGPENEASNMV